MGDGWEVLAWHSLPGCPVPPVPRGWSCPTCPHPRVSPCWGWHQHRDPAKLARHQQGHPGLAPRVACHCHTATPPRHCHPMATCPLALPHSWWHLHKHHGTSGGTSVATCPLVSPHPWWSSMATCPPSWHPQWHLHGHVSPGVTTPVVAPPWPCVLLCHHTHGGTSMATCPLVSPKVASPQSPVPHHGTSGSMARPHVPCHCHTTGGWRGYSGHPHPFLSPQ